MLDLVLYIRSNRTDPNTLTKVDLYKDEKVSMNLSIQDIRDIEKVRTDFSQPFTLPASETNNKLFQHWNVPEVSNFDSNFRVPAVIELNYLPFRKGYVTLNSVKEKNGAPKFYNITFIGETVDLKNVIGEDRLDSLTWLNNFSFPNNRFRIRTGLRVGLDFTVDSVSYTEAVIYPLISHSVRFIYDSSNPSDIYTNVWNNSASANNTGVFPEDIKPAIKVDLILKAIEEKYNLSFSDDFLRATTGDYAGVTENLYLWLHRDKGKVKGGGTWIPDSQTPTPTCTRMTGFSIHSCDFFNQVPVQLGSNLCDQDLNYDYNGEVYVTKYLYSVQAMLGLYQQGSSDRGIRVDYEITPASGFTSTPFSAKIIDNQSDVATVVSQSGTQTLSYALRTTGQSTSGNLSWLQGATVISAPSFHMIDIQVSSDLNFEFTLKLSVRYSGSYPQYFFQGGSYYGDCYPNYIVKQWGAEYTTTGGNLTPVVQILPTAQLPEMKVLEFLTGLFKTFNLTAFKDPNTEQIIVKTLDDFYSDFVRHDITEYVDTDETVVAEALPFTNIEYRYPEPKSILAQQFERLNNRRYGELEYVANASKGRRYEVKSPFGHMLYERLTNANTGNQTSIQHGTFLDDQLQPSIGKPLLLYAMKQQTGVTPNFTSLQFIDGVRPADVTQAPNQAARYTLYSYFIPHNASDLAGTAQSAPPFNLNFGSEVNSYTLTDYGGANNSLFSKFYTNYIIRVFDNRNRLFTYKAKLPLDFLLNFKMSDKLVIGTREYRINKIKVDMQTGKADLELLNIF